MSKRRFIGTVEETDPYQGERRFLVRSPTDYSFVGLRYNELVTFGLPDPRDQVDEREYKTEYEHVPVELVAELNDKFLHRYDVAALDRALADYDFQIVPVEAD